jgi:hypothetical protein
MIFDKREFDSCSHSGYCWLMEIFLTGLPLASMNLTQKSLMPGPLMIAPRRIFLPLCNVSRGDTPSSFTIRLSPERSAGSQSHVGYLFITIDDGHSPEQHAISLLAKSRCEPE